MFSTNYGRFNPNPIAKLFVVGLLGFTVTHYISYYFECMILIIISLMYLINGYYKDAIKSIIIFPILFFIPNFKMLASLPIFI